MPTPLKANSSKLSPQSGIPFTGKASSGFTLMELLVVVAVLGVLMTVVMVLLNPLHYFKLSRDAERKSDLQNIQTALELYYQDNNAYPSVSCANPSSIGLSPSYIKTVPSDPGSYTYQYTSVSGTDFVLAARMEAADNHLDSPCGAVFCTIPAAFCYKVENDF